MILLFGPTFLLLVITTLHAAPVPGARALLGSETVVWRQQLALRSEALRRKRQAVHTDVTPDSTFPTITKGVILTPQLDVSRAPSAPAIRVTYTAAAPGLSEIDAVYASPSRQQSLISVAQNGLYGHVSGRYVVQQILGRSTFTAGAFGHYAEPGPWRLTDLAIMDTVGNVTEYSGPTLAQIVKNQRVVLTNIDAPDVMAPEISSGKVLTKNVSRSAPTPLAKISMEGSDDVSGIVQGKVELSDGNGNMLEAISNTGAPVLSGHFMLYVLLNAATPTGIYRISSFSAADVPGNSFVDSNPADVATVFGAAAEIDVTE